MPLPLKQQSIIDIFESNEFLKKSRTHLNLKEKRLMLHAQFLEFTNSAGFNINYNAQSYNTHLDNFKILHLLDVELAVKLGVQFSLWGETIYKLGTVKHQDYITKTSNISILGCFAMTEIGHGSNISRLETTAKYDTESKTFRIHSPTYTSHKFWIGQAAMFAQYSVVFAQLYIKKICYGVHPFIVKLRDVKTNLILPGIIIKDCGYKNGLDSVDNGEITFNNVVIPYDNLLDKLAQINDKGEYISVNGRISKMLNELTKNRIGLGEGCNIISRYYLKQTMEYSMIRKQFGGRNAEEPIINYPSHHKRLFPLLANSLILAMYCKGQRKNVELKSKSHISSVITKIYGTWDCIKTLQECREACGGHGYHLNSGIGETYRHIEIYATFEGDNNVLLQQIFLTTLKKIQKTMNKRGWSEYKLRKFCNIYVGSLNDCFNGNSFNYMTFITNLDYIIKYKVTHIALLLHNEEQSGRDPFFLWKSKLNDIIEVSRIIAFKHILDEVMLTKHNYMINYLIRLFIVLHIKEHINIYAQFMRISSISNLSKYENKLYRYMSKYVPYYLYRLDVPEIKYLRNKNHLYKIAAKL